MHQKVLATSMTDQGKSIFSVSGTVPGPAIPPPVRPPNINPDNDTSFSDTNPDKDTSFSDSSYE